MLRGAFHVLSLLLPELLDRVPDFYAGGSFEKEIDDYSRDAEEIIRRTAGKPLPDEAVSYILTKTDGIPLFLEEMTKTLVESEFLRETDSQYLYLVGDIVEVTLAGTP